MCASHGGRQKRPQAAVLPQCEAIAKQSRQQCSKRVSQQGQKFCPAHGGPLKTATTANTSMHQQNQGNPTTNNSSAWMSVWITIIVFLLDKHPARCSCTPTTRCQTIQIIRWMTGLMMQSIPPQTAQLSPDQLLASIGTTTNPGSFWAISLFQLITKGTMPGTPQQAPTPPTQPATAGDNSFTFRMPSDIGLFPSSFMDDNNNMQSPL